MAVSDVLYALALRLYPRSHRERFGEEMRDVFSQQAAEARHERGIIGMAELWIRTLGDVASSVVKETNERNEGETSMKKSNDKLASGRMFLWLTIITVAILLIPLVAMQFTSEVNWSPFDFAVIGVLIFVIGTAFIVGVRRVGNGSHRMIFGFICVLLLMYVWAELAVGIFTNLGS